MLLEALQEFFWRFCWSSARVLLEALLECSWSAAGVLLEALLECYWSSSGVSENIYIFIILQRSNTSILDKK